jgi:steroid 5-alpha reductase family enzyme
MKLLRQPASGIAISVAIGALIGWGGSNGSARVGGLAVFGICAALAYLVNWAAFVPSFLHRTERFYDITGTLTYVSMIAAAVASGPRSDVGLVLAALVLVWALRLGTFLFRRISQDGSDGRFDRIKSSFPRFALTWTMQAMWCLLTASCALAVIASRRDARVGWTTLVGFVVWLVGFGVEVVADQQKRAFRRVPANKGRFITGGLWAWSRHPNYFGEIVLWVGISLIAVEHLRGWQFLTLISPVFVWALLTRISGIPLLDAIARRRWGKEPEYQAYLSRTPALVPRPPSSRPSPSTPAGTGRRLRP